MIKVCRSCLAATLAALMLTVPIVAVDQGNQPAGNERVITEIQLNLKPNAALPEYIGSEIKDPNDIFDNNSVKYSTANGDDNALGVLKDPKYQYVTNDKKEYSDKIFWPIAINKNNNLYFFDGSKKLSLKFTFGVGQANGTTYKIDTTRPLPVKIGDRKFTIDATQLKDQQDGKYTVYLPLRAYRKVKFIPDGGFEKLCLKGGQPQPGNQLEYDVDLEEGKLSYPPLRKEYFDEKLKAGYTYLGMLVEVKNNNKYFCDISQPFAYLNLDESNKADALKPLLIDIMTKKEDGTSKLPPILIGQNATIEEGKKIDLLSLVKLFRKEVGADNDDGKDKITFRLPAGFNPDNPTHGTYKVTMSFKNEANGLEASWTSTVTVVGNPKPPVPDPQPQPKQQEKTGNAYFDLGRYLLPTCPDSKCAKTETGAKKDDVPNTAAAVNN